MCLAPLFLEPKARVGVRAICNYASAKQWQGPAFTSDDFRGRFLVGALKADLSIIKGYQKLPIGPGGSEVKIDKDNFELVPPAWAAWAAKVISDRGLQGRVVLTPLPSSKTVPSTVDYRTLYLANLVKAAFEGDMVVWSGVRFRQKRQKVHEGGDRATIADDMIFVDEPPPGIIVPLDDVYTMGSHLSALMKHLPEDRYPSVMVCGGRTIWDTPPTRVPDEFYHDFYG